MALQLKTNHPLYSNITAFICVDHDGVVKDLTGNQVCTPNASVTYGDGEYGSHFTTTFAGSDSRGVGLSPGIYNKNAAFPSQTTFVVVNNINSSVGTRGMVFGALTATGHARWTPSVLGTGQVRLISDTLTTGNGTSEILNTGPHSFGGFVNNASNWAAFVNGVIEVSGTGRVGNISETSRVQNIGGMTFGGYGGVGADYVYVVQFNRVLTAAEIESLHASLGENNQFELIQPSPVASLVTVSNQQVIVGYAGSIDASTFFVGSNTPFTYFIHAGSLAGTGLSLDPLTGIISGTPGTIGTISGIQVGATDTDNNSAFTNAFNIDVVAAPQLPNGTFSFSSIGIDTSSATISYTYSSVAYTAIQYRVNGGAPTVTGSSPLSLSSLVAGTTYLVEFQAINAAGSGDWSAPVNITIPLPFGITLEGLCRNDGTLWVDQSGIVVDVYDVSTGLMVVRKTGLTSSSTGNVSVYDDLFLNGVTYHVVVKINTSIGVAKVVVK